MSAHNFKDISGKTFGRLTVVGLARVENDRSVWNCRCSCGNMTTAFGYSLKRGNTSSCGCLHRERSSSCNKTHGLSKTSMYSTWSSMIARCTRESSTFWHRYGGRGIRVCPRWFKFEHFLEDMGPKPSPKHSIDRIDNDLGYSPENCRWATMSQQRANIDPSSPTAIRFCALNGESLPVKEWASRLGISRKTLTERLDSGLWSAEEALTTPKLGHARNLLTGNQKAKPRTCPVCDSMHNSRELRACVGKRGYKRILNAERSSKEH